MLNSRTPLDWAFFACGGKSAVARLLGVSRQNLQGWLTRGFPVNRCLQIEAATGGRITRQLLRPYDFGLIWPELATPIVIKTAQSRPARKSLAGVNESVGV